jgi:cobalt-zinc-cadmium efflux system membrane fusion protein
MKRIVLVLGLTVSAATVLGLGLACSPGTLNAPSDTAATSTPSSSAGLYCDEHGVPEAFCTKCHPELADKLLLCPEHGDIPEDICTKCHPEVEKKHNIKMCPKGHGLPEHFCVECGTTKTAASSASDSPDDGWCATHNQPEDLCEICLADPAAHGADAGADGAANVCRQPLPLVRLASAKLGRQIGIETVPASAETHAHTLEANAETAFDANRFADVNPRVAGYLREVKADLGHRVRAGDVLAVVDSPEVSAAKSRLISARAAYNLATVTHQRTESLARQDAVPAREELEALTAKNLAESSLLDASQSLRNLGFSELDLDRVATAKETSSLLPIVAPIDGVVVQRHAVRGEAVQATTPLFAVADTSTMWLWIDVYEADIERVTSGQAINFAISGLNPGTSSAALDGTVTWVGAQVDPTTRTTRVRAEMANLDGRLRANQFGRVVIHIGEPHEVVVVPRSAVQTKDGTEVVFLPKGDDGVYRPQRVVTRASNRRDVIEVAWGLKPGDRVVTQGSFWLKTEIMKGAIGAGCCE